MKALGKNALLVTNERDFSRGLAHAYRTNGYNAVLGLENFFLHTADFDILHIQWPEELCKPLSESRFTLVAENLRRWKRSARIVFSVNNVHPHGYRNAAIASDLYRFFLEQSDLVSHYSHASRAMIADFYPDARISNQVVTAPPSYAPTLERQTGRGSRKKDFGFDDSDCVVLLIGRIRSKAEFDLLRRGLKGVLRGRAKLLVRATYDPFGISRSLRRLERLRWDFWLRASRAVVVRERVPEEALSALLDSSDIVLVPRVENVSSGIPLLAMTFGLAVAAPRLGAYPEYFSGTRNRMFEPGSPTDLAECLQDLISSDYKAIGRENAHVASMWKWDEIVLSILSAIARPVRISS